MALNQTPPEFDPIPVVPTGDKEPNPIGVPVGYSVPKERYQYDDSRFGRLNPQSYITNVKPIYFDGDEYIPSNWGAAQIWEIQQHLAKVGLLRTNFTRNTWDSATRNAYKELLALSNAQGMKADQTLQHLLSSSSSDSTDGNLFKVDEFGNVVPAGGKTVQPLITQTTDPAALRRTFRKAVIETLGEGWSQDEINKMVAAYNNVETSRQTQNYNMQTSGQSGNIVDIPSPEDFIQSQIMEKDPEGVQAQETLGFTSDFAQLASNPAWGVG